MRLSTTRSIFPIWLLALAVAFRAAAQPPAGPAAEATVQLNFPDEVELEVLVDYVSERVGVKILYDEQIANRRLRIRAPGEIPVSQDDRLRFAIHDDEILQLARWACLVEDHYSQKRGRFTPMDMEWAKDGRTGELFILQARPETVQSQKRQDVLEAYELTEKGRVLTSGRSVGEKIACGPVRVVKNVQHLDEVREGDVLVTDKTDPDWEPTMKKAAAIVTNRGGRTCHAAIVSRELGLPAIVGTNNGTEVLRTSQNVTVSCAEGETGHVYDG